MNKIKAYICLGNSYSRPFICEYARNKNAAVVLSYPKVFLADSWIIDPVRSCSASFSVGLPRISEESCEVSVFKSHLLTVINVNQDRFLPLLSEPNYIKSLKPKPNETCKLFGKPKVAVSR